MWNTLYVYGDHAYRGRSSLWRHEHVRPEQAECCRTFDIFPKYVYRVTGEDVHCLTTDPVEVRRLVKRHPDADVEVLMVM